MKDIRPLEASQDELVLAYREVAASHGRAAESGDYEYGNDMFDQLSAIYAELRRRGAKAQAALLPLLLDPDSGVRLWAATHALEFSPSEGERVLKELIPAGRFIGLTAEMTLAEWCKGNIKFP